MPQIIGIDRRNLTIIGGFVVWHGSKLYPRLWTSAKLLAMKFRPKKRPVTRIWPGRTHRRIMPPEVIKQMEDEILEEILEFEEMKIYLQAPFTQEEIRQVKSFSCNCERNGNVHSDECSPFLAVRAIAKKRRERLLGP